jgi:hypothetical protein
MCIFPIPIPSVCGNVAHHGTSGRATPFRALGLARRRSGRGTSGGTLRPLATSLGLSNPQGWKTEKGWKIDENG